MRYIQPILLLYNMLFQICILAVLLTVGIASPSVSVRSTNDYYFSSLQVSFSQAWAYCKNAGMKFVYLPSAVQNQNLANALESLGAPTATFWIGGIYLRNGFLAKWYWVDGQEDFIYFNWASTPSLSPNVNYCVAFNYLAATKKGNWVYGPCSADRYFICQN